MSRHGYRWLSYDAINDLKPLLTTAFICFQHSFGCFFSMGGSKCQESCHIPVFQVEQRVEASIKQNAVLVPPSRNCDLNMETIFCPTCFMDKPELNNGWKTEGGSPDSHEFIHIRAASKLKFVRRQQLAILGALATTLWEFSFTGSPMGWLGWQPCVYHGLPVNYHDFWDCWG